MNNLESMYCYLVGPIDRAHDLGREWRDWIKPSLNKMGIKVINPLNKPFSCGEEGDLNKRQERLKLKENGDYDEFSAIMKKIRGGDLRCVHKSDFIIVYLDNDIPFCGTEEEITWANEEHKPVLIMCKQGKKHIPDWLFAQLPHELFFSNWDSLLDYLEYVNKTENPDTVRDRWLFFDKKENL